MRKISCFLLITLIICCNNCGLFWSPNSVVIDDSERTVKDARLVIDNFRKDIVSTYGENKVKHGYFDYDEKGRFPHLQILIDKLPQTLKFQGLRFAMVCYDHIDLIFQKNPAYSEGLRIWSIDAKQEHKDKPTKYKEIFSHSYDPDSPTSPDNIH
ncbi:MAG TPA: hypothetical protein PKY59_13505 [Pyrinomonadaceae bacterium]|nr:hypothetical protein [Pyrinomonadaceae bacterium]